MSSTVTVGNLEISSNTESAGDMVAALKPTEDKGKEPRIVEDKGRPVKEPDNALSKAASELGKKGGEAAAEARKKADKDEPKQEVKAAETEPEKHQTDSEKRRYDAKTRIEHIAREREEERERADRAEARRVELEQRLARLEAERSGKPEPAKSSPAGDERPTPDKFETYEEYVEALTEYKMEQRIARIRDEEGQRQQHQTHVEEVVTKVDTFRERLSKVPDLLEQLDPRLLDLKPTFMLRPDETPGPMNVLADEWISSEIAPQLGLYLSEHEDEVIRILRLPNAREIARAVARLEDKLTVGPVQEDKPRSSTAPPPIKPVTPSSAPVTEDVYGEIDFDTFVKRKKRA